MSLERRSVVSILLFPSNPYATKPYRFLLFRRSEKVRTYQKKLAPIAGSIESSDASPLSAAWRELREETGLGPSDVELWRRGPGFEFTDETAVSGKDSTNGKRGRVWKVWPFAFCLKREVSEQPGERNKLQLRIDWEHTNYEWRTVDEILNKSILDDCVPRLEVTLGQVWVSPESALHQALENLRLDHSNGARQLATIAVESMIDLITHERVLEPKAWWRDFRLQAFHLAFNGRPSMAAAISKSIVTALSQVGDTTNLCPEFPGKVKLALKSYIQQRSEIAKRVGAQLSAFLKETCKALGQDETRWIKILTLSSSSTIKTAVLYALNDNPLLHLEIRVLESRPLFEGVSFAEFLKQEPATQCELDSEGHKFHSRLRVVIGTDASVGILSKGIDLMMLGADRISEQGDVSNKTGSLPAVLTSKHITKGKCRVICISETDKIAPPGSLDEHGEEDNDPDEVSQTWNLQSQGLSLIGSSKDAVNISNIYFEWVPAGLIDHYICEDGVLSTTEIARKSKQIADLTDHVFSGL
jgi:translation initiation factor 2B subunit (eIF-2B alpha/beta/delta family)/8-oxo-dGTP pyrophosphatase MutT (NUDIX family)